MKNFNETTIYNIAIIKDVIHTIINVSKDMLSAENYFHKCDCYDLLMYYQDLLNDLLVDKGLDYNAVIRVSNTFKVETVMFTIQSKNKEELLLKIF